MNFLSSLTLKKQLFTAFSMILVLLIIVSSQGYLGASHGYNSFVNIVT